MITATQAQYDAATDALVKLEQEIITERHIPSFIIPPQDQIRSYAARAAKAAVDAALALI